MKKLLKILLIIFAFCLFTFAFIPEIILGTPAAPAVGNWYQQFLPNLNNMPLSDICFADSIMGFAITGDHTPNDTNFILKTSDGGNSWNIIYRSYRNHLRIQLINKDTVFICGGFNVTNGELVLTTNGGINWNNVNTPNTIWFDDMNVLNINTIYLVQGGSLDGGVYFTSNGGASWVQQYSAGSQNPEKIYMYNARIGFISDNSGASSIRKTTNGGLNWNMNVNGAWYFDMRFIDSLTGWYSSASNIYKTTDGGENWTLQNVPSGSNLLNLGINKLSVLNKDTLWAAGNATFYPNSQVRGILLRTTNGGNNWLYQVPDTVINNYLYLHLQFIDKNNGWAYTSLRGIHTTSGGDPIWITGIEQTSTATPINFKLFQNYPNPFNPNTKIKFHLLKQGNAEIIIFDITGRKVQKLLNEELNAGEYELDFNAASLATGTYFYKLTVTTGKEVFTDTKKMILIK